MEVSNKIQIKSALRKSFGDVLYAVDAMDESQFKKPIAEGKWSPYEIFRAFVVKLPRNPKGYGLPKGCTTIEVWKFRSI